MFNKIAFTIIGLFLIYIGLKIAITGGYYSRYGFYSDYSNYNVLVGVILSIIGGIFIFFVLRKK